MAADLQRFLNDEPIRARRPTLADRTRMWSRRHRRLVTVSAVLLILVTISTVVTSQLVASYAIQARHLVLRESSALMAERRFVKRASHS